MIRLAVVLLLSITIAPVFAGSEDDVIAMNKKVTEEMLGKIERGSADERLQAAMFMGGNRNPRYIRPLGRELLNGFRDPKTPRDSTSTEITLGCGAKLDQGCPTSPNQDPYIKTTIAWALGQIGHKEAVPYLKDAMALVSGRIEADLKQTADQRSKLQGGEYKTTVILDKNTAGPAHLRQGYVYPLSPDVHWSEADEFKTMVVDDQNEGHRMRLKSHNYVNVAGMILQSLGRIQDPSALETIQAYLEHPIVSIRGPAILAAGRQGRPAMSLLMNLAQKEKDARMKVRIARSILLVDKAQSAQYKFLLETLHDRDKAVRLETINAFRELAMGESEEELKKALLLEEDETMRDLLKDAIHNAEVDNILPVNY